MGAARASVVGVVIAVALVLVTVACASTTSDPIEATGSGEAPGATTTRAAGSSADDGITSNEDEPAAGSADPVVPAAPTEATPAVPEIATPLPAPTPTATPAPTTAPKPTPSPTPTPTPTPTPVPTLDDAAAGSTLTDVACPAPRAQIRCHTANVPLHHDAPTGPGRVELLVGVVDNGGAAAGRTPVLFLQGGPGIGAVERAQRFIGLPYDVVVIDQRGTGGSTPNLSCPEVDALWVSERSANAANSTADSTDDEIVFAAYEACADRLRSEGIDLDAFNTDTAAADTEVVRRLLDHEPWTLWGASYGTRVAQTIMRNHPDGVRAAVLDSVVPFDIDFFASIPENALRAIDQLDRACEADTCVSDHGDFGDELAEQVLAYGASPAIVTVTRPGSGTTFDYRVTGTDLIDFVFVQLYSTSALRALPRQIARADFGGVNELVTGYASRRDPEVLDLAIGAYYAAWCREEFPFHDPTADDAAVAAGNARFGTAFEDALASTSIDRLCGFFDVEPGPAELDVALSSDLPTLVFAGSFDPITPPAWSRSVADSIAGSIYVEFPDHGHGMTSSCAATIMAAFVADPLAPPDTSCVAAFGPPDFE